jgi:hypothetical protein
MLKYNMATIFREVSERKTVTNHIDGGILGCCTMQHCLCANVSEEHSAFIIMAQVRSVRKMTVTELGEG